MPTAPVALWREIALVANLCLLPVRAAEPAFSLVPTLEITSVPAFGEAGHIRGRVAASTAGPHSVLVAGLLEGRGWLPKPAAVESDGSWEVELSAGEAGAQATLFRAWLIPEQAKPVFLTGSECVPLALTRTALARDEVVRANPGQKILSFSGYRWRVKDSDLRLGPGGNHFHRDQAWVDELGHLHLRLSQVDGKWQCAEVFSEDSFGEGRYEWEILSALKINERVVLGLFTWQDDCPHHEIDIEISHWGRATNQNNYQQVVQPHADPRNISRLYFSETSGSTRHLFDRTLRDVRFEAWDGSERMHVWTFSRTSAVPEVGAENVRINLWLVDGKPPSDGQPVEIVLSAFRFTKRPD
jgi:hypothetical protein